MAAAAATVETKAPAARERPDYEPKFEEPKVPAWKKPPISSNLLARFREVLGLGSMDELPENLYLTVGLHMGLNRMFLEDEQSYKDVCDIIFQAANFPVPQHGQKILPGWIVRIRSMNCTGIYICKWHFGRDLVNIHGTWKLLDPKDLIVPDEGIRDSELNRHAARGAREEAADTIPPADLHALLKA